MSVMIARWLPFGRRVLKSLTSGNDAAHQNRRSVRGLYSQDRLSWALIWPVTFISESEMCGAAPTRPSPLQLRLETLTPHMSLLQFVLSFLCVPKWCAVAGVRGRLEPGADATLTSQSRHGALTGRQLDSVCLHHQVGPYINILYDCHCDRKEVQGLLAMWHRVAW